MGYTEQLDCCRNLKGRYNLMTTRAGTIYGFEKEGMTEDNSQIQEVGGSGSGIATSTSMADVMRMLWKRGSSERHNKLRNEENWRWNEDMSTIDNTWKCCSLW